MSGPDTINPDTWFDADALSETLGLRFGAIDRARKSGALRCTRRGGRILFRGRWVEETPRA
jgi:hypothetical protein